MATPRKRTLLTHDEKRDIFEYYTKHPNCTQLELSNFFSTLWQKPVKRRTVGDILLQKSVLCECGAPPRKRHRSSYHGDMEQALSLWFTQTRASNTPVTDKILREKAKEFGDECGITDFKFSNGWLSRFKSRHGISCRNNSGESVDKDPILIYDGQAKAEQAINDYELKDVFYVVQTKLLFRLLPDRSLFTSESVDGLVKLTDWFTVALTFNADGSHKLKPFVIGKSLRPRCFKTFNVNLYVDYTANSKAWMNSLIFDDFLHKFNLIMKRENRNVLLIMDNGHSHKDMSMSNVKIHFLPPTTTSHLQPLDTGIIQCFKSNYRKMQLRHLIDCINTGSSLYVPLNDAIRYVKRAWDNVTPDTINNYWKHSGVIPYSDNVKSVQDDRIDDEILSMFDRVCRELDLDDDVRLTVSEFVNGDKYGDNFEIINDNFMVESGWDSEEEFNDDDDDPIPPTVTYTEAKTAMAVVVRYLEGLQKIDESDITKASQLHEIILRSRLLNKKQLLITDFFKP